MIKFLYDPGDYLNWKKTWLFHTAVHAFTSPFRKAASSKINGEHWVNMMVPWHEKAFHITGAMDMESTGHWWISGGQ